MKNSDELRDPQTQGSREEAGFGVSSFVEEPKG